MTKKLVLVFVLLVAFSSWTFAIDKAAETVVKPVEKPTANLKYVEGAKQQVDVYFTDFETEGEWEAVNFGAGPDFTWVTDNSHSETHSWHLPDDAAMAEADAAPADAAIVSPMIDLPADFDGYEPKVLEMEYWADVETPNTADGGYVYDVFEMEMEVPYEGENLWHTDTEGGYEGTSSWWCGDPETGTYNTSTRQQLVTPVLDLSGAAGDVMLTFKNAPNSEPDFDYCYLDVSSDGGATFTNIAVWDEENDPRVWYDESFNITEFATEATVVRWRMESDGGYESPDSWRIDDILISDGTTDFLFDDGGDTATELIPVENPLSWKRMHYEYDDGRLGDSWFVVDPVTIFNGSLDLRDYAGMTTRFQIRVTSDGWNRLGEAPGYGYYFDDVRVYGQGVAQIDGAIVGIGGLFMAAPGKPMNAVVYMANEGIQDLVGPILWYGSVKDEAGNELAKPVGKFDGTLAQGEVAAVPTLGPTQWVPMKPGNYTFEVTQLQINQDGWPVNNLTEPMPFVVHGPPFTELAYAEDFTGGSSLDDFGWAAMNGGTSGDTWIWDSGWGGYGQGPTLSGYYNFVDIDSTFDETVISGPINIAAIDPHNILMLDFFLRYQPGHPVLDDYYPGLFGFQPSTLTVSVSTDSGETWVDVMTMADEDTLGGTGFVYNDYVSIDLTEFLGKENIWLKFNFQAPDGYIFVCGFSEVMVYAGVSKPGILEVVDIPEDQGKAVHMAFRGSFNDLINWEMAIPVVRYDIWRGYEMEAPGAAAYNSIEDMVRNASVKLGDRVYTEDHHMIWDYVSSVPAKGMGIYGAVLPTLWDGMEANFLVIARTEMPDVFAVSAPMAGMSEDNLAPSAPGALVVETVMEEAENALAWTEAYSSVDDIAGYNVYRSTDENAQGDVITTTTELEFVDTDVEVEKQYYYTVTAIDFAGNESNGTKGTIITSVGKADLLPTAYKMDQNYPNPFNPTTTINFALPEASDVVLTIFNSNGQVVETLQSGRMAAGYHKVNWNATTASAGIYFVRLKANDFQKTIKMTLVK